VTDDVRAALELALDYGLAYTGLRAFTPDARLFHYVPITLAAREGVVPVVLVGDTLKVASAGAHPDLAVVEERFPRLTLETLIAPRPEIERALERTVAGEG
jgi:hypothetical protein